MASMQGKVALITGGSSGIGRAAAVAFAREGARVVVASRREAEGNETIGLVKAAGSEGLFVRADVAQDTDVKALVTKTVRAFGRLDYAFNNAGVEEDPGPFTDKT